MKEYTTTVGIEVHVELQTKSKMFCGCKNDPHASKPNQNICPVCMAHPGTLPVVNKEAVRKVILVGAAIGADLASFSEFDRKNYFYPDIPKAYQISQYAYPLISGGEIDGVAITRIHLEEDTARSQHDQGEGSLVDFNRAGVPLMELVTEPVIHDAQKAGDFTRELQLLLRTLGVSEANMERGEMRVEANISVSPDEQLGTKVEVKNLNSFKAMEAAIEFETKRHIKAIETGETLVQETRGWDEAKGKTFSQRTKESANDYRYFPDPDIPKYDFAELPEMQVSRMSEIIPKLAPEMRNEYRNIGLSEHQSELIIHNPIISPYYQELLRMGEKPDLMALAANYLTSDLTQYLDSQSELPVASAPQFIALLKMVLAEELNSRGAKDLLKEVVFEAVDPKKTAEERGLIQQNNEADVLHFVQAVIAENESVVAEYKAGKEASLKYLVGQGMKLSRGSANPQLLEKLLRSEIGTN